MPCVLLSKSACKSVQTLDADKVWYRRVNMETNENFSSFDHKAMVWSWRATRNSQNHCYLKASAEFLPQQFFIPSWIDLAFCSTWLKHLLKDFFSYSLFHLFFVLRSALCSSVCCGQGLFKLLEIKKKLKYFVWPLKTWLYFAFNVVAQLSSMTEESFPWCIVYIPWAQYAKKLRLKTPFRMMGCLKYIYENCLLLTLSNDDLYVCLTIHI